jgi:hypothetical protein
MSDNKKLLNESTIRRFQKLASIPGMKTEENDVEETEAVNEEAEIFAPNHYCIHHGGVNHNGKIELAEAVNHNWNEKLGRVTHYDMKLQDGTILENVPAEDIQITNATLESNHGGHKAKRHDDEKKDDDKVEEAAHADDEDKEKMKESEELEETEELEEEEEIEEYGSMPGKHDDDDDMGDDPDMDMEDVSLSDEEAQLLISLGQKLAAAMDDEGEADDAMEMPMDDEEGDDDEMPPMEEGEDIDELVNEIYKRVAKRIVAEKLKNK